MARRRVYITGGGGRIGQLLRQQWATETAFDPVFLTRSVWEILKDSPPPLTQSDVVLDLAGRVRGEVSVNPTIASRVADWARAACASYLYMSSASVYAGGPQPMRETDQLAPSSPYGQSKVASEAAATSACSNTTILRLGNVAGIDALLGGLRPGIPALLDQVTGQAGGPVRSYIGPKTLAEVLSKLLAIVINGGGLPGVINIAQPNPVSMADLLRATGHDWAFGPEKAGVIPRVELSTERLASVCKVTPASAEQLVREASEVRTSP